MQTLKIRIRRSIPRGFQARRALLWILFITLPLSTGFTAPFTASVSGYWTNAATWGGGGTPGDSDDAVINNAVTVTLDRSSANLNSLTNNGTLIFSGWSNTVLTATVVQVNGTITHNVNSATTTNASGQWVPDNRVYIVCTNLTVGTGGVINVDGKGYAGSKGPGNGGVNVGGGGYGGVGGTGDGGSVGGNTYGAADAPLDPGSGGSMGGAGGGVVRIDASGNVTVNGTITANGVFLTYSSGSGGGIYITCGGAFSGATTGVIRANSANAGYGSGGGGRIALICTNMVRDNVKVQFATRAGVSSHITGGGTLSSCEGGLGTLYLSNTNLISEATLSQFDYMRIIVPGFTEWSVTNLTISNRVVSLGSPSGPLKRLTVANDLTIVTNGALIMSGGLSLGGVTISYRTGLSYSVVGSGTNPVLTVGGNVLLSGGSYLSMGVNGSSSNIVLNVGTNLLIDGGALVVGGSNQAPSSLMNIGNAMTLTNGGNLRIFAGLTNSAVTNYGALVAVTGAVTVGASSWIYPYAHQTNGGSVLFQAASLLIATTNGGIDADGKGYVTPYGPGYGFGSRNCEGGGYGGKGGIGATGNGGGRTNGSAYAPLDPGTAGHLGGAGGGAVRIAVPGNVTVNGRITANAGEKINTSNYSGGSGGGIYINCGGVFSGAATGVIQARGSTNAVVYGAGGGGRIAVWSGGAKATWDQGFTNRIVQSSSNARFNGATSVTNGTGAYNPPDTNAAFPGTLWFFTPSPGGSIIYIR